ncbi:MAG: carboxypeptidase regulatory-like domain-containing protein, partial [Planctomycetota bacterium]
MSPTRQKRTSLQRARAVDGVRARRIARFLLSLTVTLLLHGRARVEAQAGGGSIRGLVQDADLDVPLPGVEVLAVEAGRATRSGDQGNYLLEGLEPGRYTLVFTKDGYLRQVRADVVVSAGALTELDVSMSGDFTDLEEFVVQDILQAAAGTEAAMLELRFESPALMDSISADLMSRAGASDAATGLRLVSGASVQDGKFAVIRGLPDRYVSSQMNGVRLPSADEDKRAVELDQFPAAVIESLVVTKTFLPDQQGDASGGAVDVRLKGIPDGTIVEFKAQTTYDTQATGNSEFLSYDGGGVNFLGNDSRDIQTDNLGGNWSGAAGVEEVDAPINYKWSAAVGSRMDLSDDWVLGGFASLFYERDSTFFDNGKDDSYWVDVPGEGLVPQTNQGTPSDGDFKTALFDVTQGSELVQWGGLGTLGLESDEDALGLTYLYSRTAEDTATLAVDTRGKEYFFPGYDPTDPTGTGNTPDTLNAAPYLRLETLEYTERWTSTLQLDGEHELDWNVPEVGGLDFGKPEFTWIGSLNTANLYQPDKRQFGALWHASSFNPGFPPFIHEAALRAEATTLAATLAFLNAAAKLVPAPEGLVIYDPVPHVVTKRAGYERAQLVVQSPSRPVLQAFLKDWS